MIPNFREFIKNYYNWFDIDIKSAEKVVMLFQWWADKSIEFENYRKGFYFEKGILLSGNVGTGKTEIMRLFSEYLKFIGSLHQFRTTTVWGFSEKYRNDGYNCFNIINKGNWFFDELGLTNETNGELLKETVNNYGNKIIIGQEIIFKRYNIFKETGYQTHFTTNLTPKQLKLVYGERCFSRLIEMCNFIDYSGIDRRLLLRPVIYNDCFTHDTTQSNNQSSSLKTEYDKAKEVRDWLDSIYVKYREQKNIKIYATHYDLLVEYGVTFFNEEYLSTIEEQVIRKRNKELLTKQESFVPISRDERNSFNNTLSQYLNRTFNAEELLTIKSEAKLTYVRLFFDTLIESGKTTIF